MSPREIRHFQTKSSAEGIPYWKMLYIFRNPGKFNFKLAKGCKEKILGASPRELKQVENLKGPPGI